MVCSLQIYFDGNGKVSFMELYIYIFYILYTKCNGSDALKSSIPWGLTHSWSMLLYIIHYNATEGVDINDDFPTPSVAL